MILTYFLTIQGRNYKLTSLSDFLELLTFSDPERPSQNLIEKLLSRFHYDRKVVYFLKCSKFDLGQPFLPNIDLQ